MNPRVMLRRIDMEAGELREGQEHRLFRALEIPPVIIPRMDDALRHQHEELLRLSRSDDLDVIQCVCKQSTLLSNDLLLLQVNKALHRHEIGILVYRIQGMDTHKESLKHRGMWTMSSIAAYPERTRAITTTGCKSIQKLRGYVKTIFGNSQFLPGCNALSVTSGYDLEGFKLLEERPEVMQGHRRVPTLEGFCYGETVPAHVFYFIVVPGECAIYQRAAAEAF